MWTPGKPGGLTMDHAEMKKQLQKTHDDLDILKDQLVFRHFDLITKAVEKAQELGKFIIVLSLGIIGVIIPLLIGNSEVPILLKKLLIIPFVSFSFEVVIGLLIQMYVIGRELSQLPKQLDENIDNWNLYLRIFQEYIREPSKDSYEKLIATQKQQQESLDKKKKNKPKFPWVDYIYYGNLFFGILTLGLILGLLAYT